jgi:hypothetical protein
MSKFLKGTFSYHGLVALATFALVVSEILKYDYETKKGSIETVWRLNERLDSLKPARSCSAFLGEWEALDSQLIDIVQSKPIRLKSLNDKQLGLFRRCVGADRDLNLGAAKTEAGIDIEVPLLLEMRAQLSSLLNVFDYSLAPYRNLDINNYVVCENMIGFFYSHESRSDKNPNGKTRFLRVIERYIALDLINEEEYANLPRFLKDIDQGKCPSPEFLPWRFVKKVYSSAGGYLSQALKLSSSRH